jgi:hypothetical protein
MIFISASLFLWGTKVPLPQSKTTLLCPIKCKSMLVGKNTKDVINSKLMVDKWTENYTENIHTGEADLEEVFCGVTEIEQTSEQK